MPPESRQSPRSPQGGPPNAVQHNLQHTIQQLRDRLPPALQPELDFELELFSSRLELLDARSDPKLSEHDYQPQIDYPRIRRELHAFLKEDLVFFLRKILAGEYEPPPGFPMMPDLNRDIADILRELGVFVNPTAKDYSGSTILERWYVGLLAEGPLSVRSVLQYFAIYRSRLYSLHSLEEDRPYLFQNPGSLVRHLIRRSGEFEQRDAYPGLRFEQIYRAEIKLREEIQMALLRRQPRRLDYLVAKEMVTDLSDRFITELHLEFERYYEERLQAQAEVHSRMVAEKDHLDRELRQAARLQARSIQKDLPADDARLNFALWYEPFSTVGGDYYRVIPLDADVYGIFVADITGHGISAAMHFNTVVNSFEKFSEYFDRPDKLLRKMNEDLYGQLRDHFLTAIYVRLDLKKRTLDYCNAGHPKGFLAALPDAAPDESRTRRKVRFLRPNGKVLGAFRKAEFPRQTLPLYDRCRLILYTDGISETVEHFAETTDESAPPFNLLGERGLLDLFDARTTGWDPARTLAHVQEKVRAFQGAAAPEDDRTLLITDITCRPETKT